MSLKNIIIFILSIAALFGWGMVIYQNNLREESEKRIEERIMDQVDHLLGTYSSIRQEVESSEKIKNLLTRQEELRQTRDLLVKQLQDYHNENLESKTKLGQFLKEESENATRKYSEHELMLLEQTKELAKINSRNHSQDSRLTAWESKAAELDRINQDYHDQIRSILNKNLQETRQKQEKTDNQISELKARLEQYITQGDKKSETQDVPKKDTPPVNIKDAP
ncbi:MAG: hypothetical protein ABH882_00725 [Candidatus Omnitrophota bacterium]|nr:hypothetical protein [Candidatus Omnitrophota bacterium]MBU1928898.1 hypothetical protein [Candidatus Omnitrophota bacterium]MBU2034508.1 hypothetical protein [Candidatus Omnitrophota bacterium]MBU2221444.1 hypothetical protein [Candidatus Omnitrophota bacterium]MBU2258594.1 hypothetical protein [Candidatus Omnitrophota bacterium]